MSPDDVDVVILNWRTAPLAIEAARSAIENGATSIIVVDNCSQDDSIHLIKREIGSFVGILSMPRNGGFGEGNNAGARLAKRPLVLFMNTDVKLQPGALKKMAEVFDKEPRAAVVSPALYYPDNRPHASAFLFPTPVRTLKISLGLDRLGNRFGLAGLSGNIDIRRNGAYSGRVESLYGACLLVRREAFEEVGGFDEDFFMYCEETDLIFRLAQKGWKAIRVSSAEAIHTHGESVKGSPVDCLIPMYESRRIYARKHFSRLGRITASMASAAGLLARILFSSRNSDRLRYLAALRASLGMAPKADPRQKV